MQLIVLTQPAGLSHSLTVAIFVRIGRRVEPGSSIIWTKPLITSLSTVDIDIELDADVDIDGWIDN